MRKLIRALFWFVASPKYWRNILNAHWWSIAASCHWSSLLCVNHLPEWAARVSVGRRTTIRNEVNGRIVFDDGVWIGDDCEISVLREVQFGQDTSVQHRSQIHGDVEFGSGCVCAANLYVSSSSHRFRDSPYLPIRWQDAVVANLPVTERSQKVVVEDDCWLGINVVICPGVTIGRGTIVGANAVVTSSTMPYTIVAGVPARVIGQRLSFQPPLSVHARNKEDIPYFYAGFMVLADSQIWEDDTVNGWFVRSRFAIALQVKNQSMLRLELQAITHVQLVHGLQEFNIQPGMSNLIMEAVPDGRGLLWFSVNGWSPKCLVVYSASMVGVIRAV